MEAAYRGGAWADFAARSAREPGGPHEAEAMKTKLDCRAWSFLLVASLALGGCVVAPVDDRYYEDEVVVVTPPARVEYRGYPPVAGYIWIDGFWNWSGYRHDWVPGYWAPPHHRHFRPPVRRAYPEPRHFERDRGRDRDRSHGWTGGDDRRRDSARDRDARREPGLARPRQASRTPPRAAQRERLRPERREQLRPQPRPGFGERMRDNAGAAVPRAVQSRERRPNPATLRERIDARRRATGGEPRVGRATGEARPQRGDGDPRARPSWPRQERDGGG